MEEQIDILDEQGKPTGEVDGIKSVHEKGLWHRTVHVWFVNSKKEILLQKRSHTSETYPHKWDISAAGHISAGQSSAIAALRETEEEIGINLLPEDLIFITTIINRVSFRN